MTDEIVKSTPKIDGRSKAARAAKKSALQAQQPTGMSIEPNEAEAAPLPRRTAPRPVQPRANNREQTRESSRSGTVTAIGRDGEVLSRRFKSTGDEFDVPRELVPDGWEYQWNVVSVHNQEVVDQQLQMQANGWRPVPAERHPGRWTATNHKGAIIVKGLRLEERPKSLSDEARAEDYARAKAQVRDQTDSLRLTEKLPSGMAIGGKYRGTGADVRLSVDHGLDIPRPDYDTE